MSWMLKNKNKNISCLCFKTQLKSWKASYFFNDSKRIRMALYYNKKIACIIRRNNHKTSQRFLLSHLPSFFCNRKQRKISWKTNENKYFCSVARPSEDTWILEFNHYQKSDKSPFIAYADLEYLIEKTDGCKNKPENLSKTKANEHIPSGFSMSTISSFRGIKNKHDVYRGKDCTKKFCESFREHPLEIIDFKRKKNEFINKRAANLVKMQKPIILLKKKLKMNMFKIKIKVSLRIIVLYRGV